MDPVSSRQTKLSKFKVSWDELTLSFGKKMPSGTVMFCCDFTVVSPA